MAKVELKQPIVDEIKAQLDGAKSMVVVDYRGISVADVLKERKDSHLYYEKTDVKGGQE